VQKRRAILVPINVELKGELLAHQLRDSAPKLIISDRSIDGLSAMGLSGVSLVGLNRTVDGAGDGPAISFEQLCAATDADAILSPTPGDICLILYTSGTSGASKGVLIPQAHAYLFGLLQARALSVSAKDRFFVALPMFHVNALLMSLGACLVTGAQAHVVAKFSASRWLSQVRTSEATVTNCLGIMAEFILRQPETAGDRTHKLRSVMAVPVSAQWGAGFEARFGVSLVQVYGMTECNIVTFTQAGDVLEPGCVGPVCEEFFDLRILDPETDQPVPAGSVGEIAVRPKVAFAFMQGYLGLPEVTVRAWRNLWFHTGDAGRLDASGRLHFVDRLGDCIRRRGENISSSEIEQVLATHPGIVECSVVGVRIEGAGGEDEIKACIVREPGILDYGELLEWSEAHLPRYAVPRFWEFVDALEKTSTGKVKKKELRSRGVTEQTWDRERSCSLDRREGARQGALASRGTA
jgi:crotonobetaine/carnitine-CoA ligase